MPGGPDFAESIPKHRPGLPGRAIIIIILIAGLLFVVGLKYAWSRLDITVSKPTLVGGQIQGSFRLHHDLNGILSKGIGGACMIGDFADLLSDADVITKGVVKGTCTEKSQCNPNLVSGKPGPKNAQKWEGYCIKNKIGQGKCWYKPWDDPNDGLLCETSGLHLTPTTPPAPTPWQVGIDYPVPKDNGFSVQDFYNRYTGGNPAEWRVSGRLFRTNSTSYIEVFGKPVCIQAEKKKKCRGIEVPRN